MDLTDHKPGDMAPQTGVYIAHNVSGSPTEMETLLRKGETLPQLPRGFTWRLAATPGAGRP